jgi:UDP-N-acetyl-D-glucosamine dehydrogenase
VHTVLDAAASKPFGFMPFRAGPGTGGRCIPLATEYLVAAQRSAGLTPRLTQAAMTVNRAMPDFVVRRLDQLLAGEGRSIAGARVLVVGLAYKANVADARNSSAAALVRSLSRAGATVQGYDELVPVFEVDGRPLAMLARLSAVREPMDAAILHTHHRDLDEVELSRAARIVLDTRGTLDPTADNVHRL